MPLSKNKNVLNNLLKTLFYFSFENCGELWGIV